MAKCNCNYGLIHEIDRNNGKRQCNYFDMISCVNQFIQAFMFSSRISSRNRLYRIYSTDSVDYTRVANFENPIQSRDSNIEDQCPAPCKSFTFSVEQVTVCNIWLPYYGMLPISATNASRT